MAKPRHEEVRNSDTRKSTVRKGFNAAARTNLHIDRSWLRDDMKYKWARERNGDKMDRDNLERWLRLGWTFVAASEIPQWEAISRMPWEPADEARDGYIRRGGHILMKKPLDEYTQDVEDQRAFNKAMGEKAHWSIQEENRHMPRYEIIDIKRSTSPVAFK